MNVNRIHYGRSRRGWGATVGPWLDVFLPDHADRIEIGTDYVNLDDVDGLIAVLTELARKGRARAPRVRRPLAYGDLHYRVWVETEGRPSASAYATWIVREEMNPWGIWPSLYPGRPRELETRDAVEARDVAEFYVSGRFPRHAVVCWSCPCGRSGWSSDPDDVGGCDCCGPDAVGPEFDLCGAVIILWPEAEGCEARCTRPVDHDGDHHDAGFGGDGVGISWDDLA